MQAISHIRECYKIKFNQKQVFTQHTVSQLTLKVHISVFLVKNEIGC